MARADYFERVIQAATHVLNGLDQNVFLDKVDKQRVAIAFDRTTNSLEGIATLDLLIRLTARFYPLISLCPLDTASEETLINLKKLARAINPKISISKKISTSTHVIVVGNTIVPVRADQTILYVGSQGWIARLSQNQPVSSGNSANPIGAGVAACLAAANIFRGIFTNSKLDNELSFSVLDLNPNNEFPLNPSIEKLDIGKVFLVGAGAIGNGFLWGLRNSNVIGDLVVIDHDSIDLGNLQRYILTYRNNENELKSTLVENFFRGHSTVTVNSVSQKWDSYLDTLPEDSWIFDQVVVALDSANDRIGVQASLPGWIVNGWTQQSEIGISRHNYFGEEACMACLYMPKGEVPHQDEIIAEALGFSNDKLSLLRIRTLIETGRPLDLHFLTEIAAAKNVPVEKLAIFEGKSINELYTKAVCSGMIMELANGPTVTQAEIPMPFQSALAGILQLASLIAHAGNLYTLPTITQIDLMKPIPKQNWLSRPLKKVSKHCFCQDSIFKEISLQKYDNLPMAE